MIEPSTPWERAEDLINGLRMQGADVYTNGITIFVNDIEKLSDERGQQIRDVKPWIIALLVEESIYLN